MTLSPWTLERPRLACPIFITAGQMEVQAAVQESFALLGDGGLLP